MWFARQTPLQFAINQQTGKQCAALRQLQPPADRQTDREKERGIQTDGMVNSCSCCSCKFPSLLLLLHICRRAAVRHKLTSDCRLSGQQRVNFVKYFNSRPSAVPFGIYAPMNSPTPSTFYLVKQPSPCAKGSLIYLAFHKFLIQFAHLSQY